MTITHAFEINFQEISFYFIIFRHYFNSPVTYLILSCKINVNNKEYILLNITTNVILYSYSIKFKPN